MIVKNFNFKRDFLKHTNFNNDYHVYTGMETVSDKLGDELPESIIKLLYRIHAETADTNDESEYEGE